MSVFLEKLDQGNYTRRGVNLQDFVNHFTCSTIITLRIITGKESLKKQNKSKKTMIIRKHDLIFKIWRFIIY